MRPPVSLRAHLMIGAGFLMVGLFGGSIILWHITLGHREPPSMFFAIMSHAHLFAILCLVCLGLGAAQVQRGWRSIDQVRGHLADMRDQPERRLTGRYPAEIIPLAADVNRLLDQRDAMIARANAGAGDLAHGLKTPLAILMQDGERAAREGHAELAASIAAQVDRMRRQVDAHLARARIDVSSHRALVPVSLLESIEGIVRTLERLYGERGIAFDMRVYEDVPVLAAREDLDEILGNVLDNACKCARTSCRIGARVDAGRGTCAIACRAAEYAPTRRRLATASDCRSPARSISRRLVREDRQRGAFHAFTTISFERQLSAEQPRCEVIQVAPPCLPFVVRSRRLVVDVVDPRVCQGLVEAADTIAHPLRLRRPDAKPEQPHFFGERLGIREGAVEVRFRIEGPAAQAARSAEPANVREQIQPVERDLEDDKKY